MKIAYYIKDGKLAGEPRWKELKAKLEDGGIELYEVVDRKSLRDDTDILLSIGGDGTFLSASKRVEDTGVPVLGVNLGRLGFLAEYSPEEVAEPVFKGSYTIEDRSLLTVRGLSEGMYPHALNEVSVHRKGASILEIRLTLDGEPLPPYWADGLLVSTSSGSTAYSMSVGGPICTPDAPVLIIAPIAPHNMNVRPLVVPDSSVIGLQVWSRDGEAMVCLDNRSETVPSGTVLDIRVAEFSLRKVRLSGADFMKALTTKLFWGEDVRNSGH